MQFLSKLSLRWRLFLATSTSITVLFAFAGWILQRYALSVADDSVRTEIRGSIKAYEAVWKTRTQILAATTALMGSMSDVRAAFMTRDEKTIRDSAEDLWSRISDASAVFLVLTPRGDLIASLGRHTDELMPAAIPLGQVADRFPKQLAGYVRVGSRLYYVVLTPVYVQTSSEPLLLNILCAGFPIDDAVVQQLRAVAPGSEFVFLDRSRVFASTLDALSTGKLITSSVLAANAEEGPEIWEDHYIVSHQSLNDISGAPVAELRILHSYDRVRRSLSGLRRFLGVAWAATIIIALLLSSYFTNRLLAPIKSLDYAAAQIAARNYDFRLPVRGSDELSRFADTFNEMCDSIQRAQFELLRQAQIHTIGRLGSSLVHDLRNPLAAVYGGAEMLVDGHLPPEQTQRVATNIYRACQRIQELLQDLVNVSRGVARNLEACRLRDIIDAAIDSLGQGLSNIAIDITIDDLEIVTDRTRVERVFANLLSNAAEAMPERDKIRIYCREQGQFLEVFVEDSGPGIAPDIREKLFGPFVTGKKSGLGLGLALSRQTMADLGGDLMLVDSTGQGACFSVRFPISAVAQYYSLQT